MLAYCFKLFFCVCSQTLISVLCTLKLEKLLPEFEFFHNFFKKI